MAALGHVGHRRRGRPAGLLARDGCDPGDERPARRLRRRWARRRGATSARMNPSAAATSARTRAAVATGVAAAATPAAVAIGVAAAAAVISAAAVAAAIGNGSKLSLLP